MSMFERLAWWVLLKQNKYNQKIKNIYKIKKMFPEIIIKKFQYNKALSEHILWFSLQDEHLGASLAIMFTISAARVSESNSLC